MARLNDRRCHIVFMDSRGVGLQEIIDRLNHGEYLEIQVKKGATLQTLSRSLSSHLTRYPFDVVYIAGGICDFTTKDHVTKNISFQWKSTSDLQNYLFSILENEDKFLTKNHPASKVIFCPLVGVYLIRVVNDHQMASSHQEIFVDTVFEFNTRIFKINKSRSTFLPAIHRTIHRSSGTKKKSHYHHLDDGLHLTKDHLEKCSSEFINAAENN